MRYRFERKKTITVVVIAVLMLLLGGAYLWYAHNYGNAENITLSPTKVIEYEWQECAASHGITSDYIWSRTKELMVRGGEDSVLIPSSYMIEGRLSYQDAEESGVYLLSDQGRLLTAYVRTSDRFNATALKNEVLSRFNMDEEPVSEKIIWLDSYLQYYVSYGNAEDYSNILSLVNSIFNQDGMIIDSDIEVVSYDDPSYLAVANQEVDYVDNVLENTTSDAQQSELTLIQGVKLSSINLELIRNLENNGLLPTGSYDRNLEIVTGGRASEDIPLYAYAYTMATDEDGNQIVSYIYSHDVVAAVDFEESVVTMRNLAEVEALPDDSYSWLKNTVMNGYSLGSEYFIVSGSLGGSEGQDALTDILAIAFYRDDIDLYDRICVLLGSRVATYTDSPALSMIYRQRDGRYSFSARENLEVCLALL